MHEVSGKNQITNVFEYGHKHVLDSLEKFTNKTFNLKMLDARSFCKNKIREVIGNFSLGSDLTLFKTEIIGDVFGKSYWLVDNHARKYITNTDNNNQVSIDFSYEMLREVDNIISAALISQLSNRFSLEIYGDVPELVMPELKPLEEIIEKDFIKSRENLFLYLVEFQIEESPNAKCLFFWCVEEHKLIEG